MHLIKFALFSIAIICLSACKQYEPGKVISASLSSDGHYVVTGGEGNSLLLWNIVKKSYRVISKQANPMSVYFLKDNKHFVWQDSSNNFHVMDLSGKQILSFFGKKSFSNIMTSDLHYLYMTDINWRFFRYDTRKKLWQKLYRGYLGHFGKPMNLTLADDEKTFLSSGFCGAKNDDVPLDKSKGMLDLDCVTLWNVKSGKPIKKFSDLLASQTYATLSPDGKYIVAGDGSAHLFVYSSETGKKIVYSDDIYSGKDVKIHNTGDFMKDHQWEKDGIISVPDFYTTWDGSKGGSTARAIRYITNTDYFLIAHDVSALILYRGLSRKPGKYLPLGKLPWPSNVDLAREGSIDSSPSAHILVTGQLGFNGINVYQYDPKTETLYRVWTPIINPEKPLPSISKDVPTLPGVNFTDLMKVTRVG